MKITGTTTNELRKKTAQLKKMQEAIEGAIFSEEGLEFINNNEPTEIVISLVNPKMFDNVLIDDGVHLEIKAFKKTNIEGDSDVFERELKLENFKLKEEASHFLKKIKMKFHKKAESVK